jgi:Transposase DDE domain
MERERWNQLYRLAVELSRGWRDGHCFSAAVIVGVYLWSVLHDRPVCWACDARNWPEEMKLGRLPSQGTMSRRLRTAAVQDLLLLMEAALREVSRDPETEAAPLVADGKPLVVGGYSKDSDAKFGRAAGGFARGYKFEAFWGNAAMPEVWGVWSMNVNEKVMAKELVAHLPGTGWIFGDAEYDGNELYDTCFEHGYRLIAPRQQRGEFGHHYQSAHRLYAADLMEGSTGFAKLFHAHRTGIERRFGNWTSFGGGLAPFPAWVRRAPRVRLWTRAKLLINACRILQLRVRASA